MTNQTGIRSYGPGKFDTILDSMVYDSSLDGCDEELGDSETFGWYGLIRGQVVADETKAELTTEERALVFASVGAIVDSNSQGFVGVQYFESDAELEAAWAALEAEYAEFAEDDDF